MLPEKKVRQFALRKWRYFTALERAHWISVTNKQVGWFLCHVIFRSTCFPLSLFRSFDLLQTLMKKGFSPVKHYLYSERGILILILNQGSAIDQTELKQITFHPWAADRSTNSRERQFFFVCQNWSSTCNREGLNFARFANTKMKCVLGPISRGRSDCKRQAFRSDEFVLCDSVSMSNELPCCRVRFCHKSVLCSSNFVWQHCTALPDL